MSDSRAAIERTFKAFFHRDMTEEDWQRACEGKDLPTPATLNALPTDEALDRLFDAVDAALYRGHGRDWPEIDEWMRRFDPDEISNLSVLVGVLSITLPCIASDWRVAWAHKAAMVIRDREPSRSARLLRGLV